MRSVSFLALLAGVAAANPAPYWPRHESSHLSTGVSSTGLQTSTPPSGTGSSSLPPNPTSYSKSESKGVATSVPIGTGGVTGTETITTFTTTTVCPVTQTSGTQVITTLTTSTITVTSCKGGCNHQPTPPPNSGKNSTVIYPTSIVNPTSVPVNPTTTPPSNPTSGSVVVPTVVTTTKFSQTLQSTSVGQNGATTIYSTYLTVNPVYGTSTIYNTYYPTVAPAPPVSQPNGGNCPPQATVTVTVVATPVAPGGYKTYTVTEGGKPTTITVPVYPGTSIPLETQTLSTPPAQSNTKSQPSGTGSIPYPTTSGAPYPSSKAGDSTTSRTGPKPTNSAGYYGNW